MLNILRNDTDVTKMSFLATFILMGYDIGGRTETKSKGFSAQKKRI